MKLSGAKTSYDRGEILGKAEKYRSQGRIRKAIREYEKILSVDRWDIDVRTKIAPLYIRIGRKEQAKDSLRLVVSWYEKKGFLEKAIATLRLALTVDRRNLAAYLHLAELYLSKDHLVDARNVLSAARKAFRGKGYQVEALAVEEKILSLAPDDFPTQVSLVRLLWRVGKRQEVLERLRCMEEQWARKGNQKNWRKTRRLLFRHAPSLSTGWHYFLSFFNVSTPFRSVKKGSPQHL
jgi:tetratricopeptide (TPR) repeat protein